VLYIALYENADFSVDTVKASIRDGELKTNQNKRYKNELICHISHAIGEKYCFND
jgi:hypothetical protein